MPDALTAADAIRAARTAACDALGDALAAVGAARVDRSGVDRLRAGTNRLFSRPIRVALDDAVAFDYHPGRATVTEVRTDAGTVDLDRLESSGVPLAAYPDVLRECETAIADSRETRGWADARDDLAAARRRLDGEFADARAAATLDDLVTAVLEDEREYAAFLLGVDAAVDVRPNSERAALFDAPIDDVAYADDDLALLRLRPTGWVGWEHAPAEAFVLGTDDTPAGFFVHSVDGTNLHAASSVDRADVLAALGVDRALSPGTRDLHVDAGERVRLQGDLCIERANDGPPGSLRRGESGGAGQLNLAIDNHLVVLADARRAPGEDPSSEPVTVLVPTRTTLHVVHDEHPQVDVALPPGEYAFHLLDRGVRPPDARPRW